MGLSDSDFDIAMRVRELLLRYPGRWETVGNCIHDLCRRMGCFFDSGAFR
jgi:hypothetical protein